MAKRGRKLQPGRFRRRAGKHSELEGWWDRVPRFAKVGRPVIGFMQEARGRTPNLKKEVKDQKYQARFKGTPQGVYEINVRKDEILMAYEDDQCIELESNPVFCVKLFYKRSGQAHLVEYRATSWTYRRSPQYGTADRARRAFLEGRVNWGDPQPMITDT